MSLESFLRGPAVAFSHADFRRYQAARLMATLATQMQSVAVGWHVYSLTRDPLDLGYVGLAQFLPAVLLWPLTGHAADRFDRARILSLCYFLLALSGIGLSLLGARGIENPTAIYAILVVVGATRAFAGPAGQALVPNLVPREHLPNAIAWNSSTWQVAVVSGPALGGLLYAVTSASAVYATQAALDLASVLLFLSIRTRSGTGASSRESSRGAALVAGIRYVWREKILLGAISLDLFAVLLGGAVALLPIFARDILHTGPTGLGLLRSAPAAGAGVTAVMLAYRPLTRHVGRTMLACVFAFGLATIVFGLSRHYALSLMALAVAGAVDMVSVFVRQSLVQLGTPDAMRGRVAAVNQVFVGASNELGEFESGIAAALLGVVPAVVSGGVGTCLIVLLWSGLFPALRRADSLDQAPLPGADVGVPSASGP